MGRYRWYSMLSVLSRYLSSFENNYFVAWLHLWIENRHNIYSSYTFFHSPTHPYSITLKPQRLNSFLSSNKAGNVFLFHGGLSGGVYWSQPSVINCHNASKLTNGLCVKEGPLIYWPPLVDSEPIISITVSFHVWPSLPTNPQFHHLTLQEFLGTWREAYPTTRQYYAWQTKPHTYCVFLDTKTYSAIFQDYM